MEEQTYNIYHDLIIKAPISRVYEAITQPSDLVNWWPLKCSGKPEIGEAYNFYFSPEYDWYAQVIKASPSEAFHLKMTISDADWDPTSFGFDLTTENDQVQLKFWHIDWPACNAHFRRSSFCWAMLLNGLKNYVEKGIIVPFEGRE